MTTDRELLEAAAKAAGFVSYDHENSLATDMWSRGYRWNPLTSDADALRLAVKLGLIIDTSDGTPDGDIDTPATRVDNANGRMLFIEAHGTDPYAATRRAIVRAAAEIERSKT
jgi:hypothetical protein